MREREAILLVVVSWGLIALIVASVMVLTRKTRPPTERQRDQLEALLTPAVRWWGVIVWALLLLVGVWALSRRALELPISAATFRLVAGAWGGLFLPSWFTMWLVRWLIRRRARQTSARDVRPDGGDVGSRRGWLNVLALGPAGAFLEFSIFIGPYRALETFGFGAGTGLLGVLAALWAVQARGRSVLVSLFVSSGLFGMTALSYLFTRDLQGSLVKFGSFEGSVLTMTSFLVLIYGVAACMVALVMLPVLAGVHAEDPACRRLYLIHVGVLLGSGFYLFPALIVTGVLTTAHAPGQAFTEFWEAHFFHTPWLLGWQVASWITIILLGRSTVNWTVLRRPLASDTGMKPRAAAVAFLVAVLAVGTVTEAWRGFWLTWVATSMLFILIATDLWRTWGLGEATPG